MLLTTTTIVYVSRKTCHISQIEYLLLPHEFFCRSKSKVSSDSPKDVLANE